MKITPVDKFHVILKSIFLFVCLYFLLDCRLTRIWLELSSADFLMHACV